MSDKEPAMHERYIVPITLHKEMPPIEIASEGGKTL
jgi:hypothetical protein